MILLIASIHDERVTAVRSISACTIQTQILAHDDVAVTGIRQPTSPSQPLAKLDEATTWIVEEGPDLVAP